uniref:Ashwin n=1 Tax=Neogobius melanostomus TaxID=47308 RepID=A0A8C6U8K7_9GOBI
MLGKSNMATSTALDGKANSTSDMDLLLHPELLSDEFLKLILNEKRVNTRDNLNREQITELYLRHVMPLPQRTLPSSRWGRTVGKTRGTHAPLPAHSSETNRKRPLIVFEGTSSNSGPLKVKRPDGCSLSSGSTDRLKPPPNANMASPIRKLTTSTSPTDTANLKREAHNSVRMTNSLNSPVMKKKIQHVTWP